MASTRREFLAKTVLATAAIGILPSCAFQESYEVGLQLYTIRDAMNSNPLDTLKKVAEIGYKKVENAGYRNSKIYGYTAQEFNSILSDLGLKNVSGHFDLDVFTNAFDEALEFMEMTGQEYVVLPWLAPNQRETLDQYREHAELLNQCGEKAKAIGKTVAYHNHDFEFRPLEGQLPMDVLLEEIVPNLVEIELDLYWISKVGLDPIEFFKKHPGQVTMWHIKDMADTPRKEFKEVGEGVIDFKRMFDNQELSGMKHFFIEQDVSSNPLESIELSFKNLTEKIL